MQLISQYNKTPVIDILSYSMWVKENKTTTINNTFHSLKESNRKLNKTLVDKCSEFYSKSIKLMLEDNAIKNYSIYSTHNDGNPIVVENCVIKFTYLINEVYNHMTEVSKTVYNNNIYCRTIKWSILMLIKVHILILMLTVLIKILLVKLVILWEYQTIGEFLEKFVP